MQRSLIPTTHQVEVGSAKDNGLCASPPYYLSPSAVGIQGSRNLSYKTNNNAVQECWYFFTPIIGCRWF